MEPAAIASALAARLGPLLAGLDATSRPAFLASLERKAGERYDAWAHAAETAADAALLRACAERERTIATRIETEFPVDAHQASAYEALIPDAARTYGDAFVGLSRAQAFTVQALLERAGANAWRGFAGAEHDPRRKAILLECATLEEASADVLDRMRGA
ncbi:MAG TPA: hypothetical protein VGK30_06495 [Candidatus Binatia bacterium]|jgi:hypothetical protein